MLTLKKLMTALNKNLAGIPDLSVHVYWHKLICKI